VFCSLQLEGSSQAVQEESREQATDLQTITMFNNKCRKSNNKYMDSPYYTRAVGASEKKNKSMKKRLQ
jgi:hypothetical protein